MVGAPGIPACFEHRNNNGGSMTDTRTSLAILSDQLADAAASGGESIVAVHARPRLPSTGIHWQDGVVVTSDGTVRRESDITVTLPDGRKLQATLAGRDRRTDLAVLRVAASLPTARLGDPASLRPGHLVLALARLGEGGPRVSFGAVSAIGGRWRCWKGGELDRLLQSNLTLYPGFGGGPLVDATGQIHGINSGGLSRAFATTIPVETVNRTVQQLLERGYIARGWLGAAMQPVRFNPAAQGRLGLDRDGGLVILSVEPDGPAASAGLLVGDVIVKLRGRPVETVDDLAEALWASDAVGRTLDLDLVRGGELVKAGVLIGERPRRSA
jgi:S1-C subfamily serine protease